MVNEALSQAQRQTARGREKFLKRFPDAQSRSEYFRQLAQRANEGRIVLSGDEAAALADAYALLGRIARRGQRSDPPPTETAAGDKPLPEPPEEEQKSTAGSAPAVPNEEAA